jgi:uncharacterized protein (DUF952 family)
MKEGVIYHLCRADDWAAAEAGFYRGPDADRADGFLHFSTDCQIEESAARHRAGAPDLVLLEVSVSALGDVLRWEPSRGGALFPHLYGPVPLAAVRSVRPLPLGPDGRHRFPDLAPSFPSSHPELCP